MVGPAMDCLNNPLGAVRTLFERACAAQSGGPIGDSVRSDWGAKELFDAYLYQQGGFKQVCGHPSLFSSPCPTSLVVAPSRAEDESWIAIDATEYLLRGAAPLFFGRAP